MESETLKRKLTAILYADIDANTNLYFLFFVEGSILICQIVLN